MPIIGSQGLMSARGFGMFKPLKMTIGNQGIMTLGGNTNATRLYNWATDGVAAATNMTGAANIPGGGCGTPVFAILPLGTTGGSTGSTNKYRHSNAAMAAATRLGLSYSSSGAYGNATTGFLVPAGTSAGSVTTILYQYSGDGVTQGANLVTPRATDATVLGDGTRAIISGSTVNNAASATLDAYTYATNTCTTTTSLPVARGSAASTGAGNDVVGIFTRAATVTATQKFVYASSTTAAAGTLALQGVNGQSSGSDVAGIMLSSSPTSSGLNKYTYANDSTSLGAALPSPAPSRPNFVNNGISGVNA